MFLKLLLTIHQSKFVYETKNISEFFRFSYPTNSSLPMPLIGQQNIGPKKPRPRKKPIKQNSVNNQEQNSSKK